MNYKRRNDTERIVLLFEKSPIKGIYTYDTSFLGHVLHMDYGNTLYTNYCSKWKPKINEKGIDGGIRFTEFVNCNSGDLYKLAINGEEKEVSGYFEKESIDPLYIFVEMDEETEKEVYKNFIKNNGKRPNSEEMAMAMIVAAEKLGRSIDSIEISQNSYKMNVQKKLSDIELSLDEIDFNSALISNDEKKAGKSIGKSNLDIIDITKKPKVMGVNDTNKKSSIIPDEKMGKVSNYRELKVDEIKQEIKKIAILQDDAVDKIINNIYLNQMRIDSGNPNLLRTKANILFDGPTGTGKTLILEETSKRLGLPMIITSINNYSTTGYRGSDLTSILINLLDKAGGDLELAERGIIVFDEIDKLSSKDTDLDMKTGLQQELLTYLSGSKVAINYDGKNIEFDTSKITFVGLGAFTNLRERKISENEEKYKRGIGFSADEEIKKERTYTITKDDYISAGLQRELVGRFSCITFTKELGIDDLDKILTESEISPLKQLKELGKLMGCELEVDNDIIYEIAKLAFNRNCGARSLQDIIIDLTDSLSNDLVSGKINKITLDKEALEKASRANVRNYYSRSK